MRKKVPMLTNNLTKEELLALIPVTASVYDLRQQPIFQKNFK